MQIIPIQAVPNQTLQVQLANQPVTLNIYQQIYGLFVDVYVSDTLIIGGVIAENMNRIVRDAYLGFVGDLVFWDSQDTDFVNPPDGLDPIYTGLGSRYVLFYLEAADLPS